MRFYNQVHQFYCGVDLQARSMYLRESTRPSLSFTTKVEPIP